MKALVVLFTLLPALAGAQDYVMFETQYLKVLPGHSKQFNAAMKAHNERFHASGPFRAEVYYVANGPRAGQVFWAMGPCTFTDFDRRPSSPDHESDWTDNVLAHAEMVDSEDWRLDPDLSHNPSTSPPPLYRVRIFDIVAGEEHRFDEIQRSIKEVLVAKNRKRSREVYRNVSASGTGRDIAIVTTYENWADLDDSSGGSFLKDYEDVHGPGSWARFMHERNAAVKQDQDEFHQHVPELSAPPSTSSN